MQYTTSMFAEIGLGRKCAKLSAENTHLPEGSKMKSRGQYQIVNAIYNEKEASLGRKRAKLSCEDTHLRTIQGNKMRTPRQCNLQ
jgi:hypothetical protein